MSRLWSCGFELQSSTTGVEWTDSPGTSTPEIDTTLKRSGDASLKVYRATNGSEYIRQQFVASDTFGTYYLRFYINITTLPGAATIIGGFYSSAMSPSGRVVLATDGTLELWDGSGKIGSSSSALNTGTWYKVDLKGGSTDGSANDTYEAKLNDVSFASTSTGIGSTTGVTYVVVGSGVSTTAYLNFDDIGLNDTSGTLQNSWCAGTDAKIIHLHPNDPGDNNDCTSGDWTSVDEVTPDDSSTYAVLDADNDILDVCLESHSEVGLYKSDEISFIQVGIRESAASSATESWKLRIKGQSGGTLQEGTTTEHNDTTYRTNGDTLPRLYTLTAYVNPQTGDGMYAEELDTFQIGVQAVDATPDIRVSTLWALVEYVQYEGGYSTSTTTTRSTSSSSSTSTSSTTTSSSTTRSTSTSSSISTSSTTTSKSTSTTRSTSTSKSTSTSTSSTTTSRSTSTSKSTSTSSTTTSSSTTRSTSTSSSTTKSTSTSSTTTSKSTSTSMSTSTSTTFSMTTSTSSTTTSSSTTRSTSTSMSTSTSSTTTSKSTSTTKSTSTSMSTSTTQSTSTSSTTTSSSTSLSTTTSTSTSSTTTSSSTSVSTSTSSTTTSSSTSLSTSTSVSTSTSSTTTSSSTTISTSSSTSTSSTTTSSSTSQSTSTTQSTSTSSTTTSTSSTTTSTSSTTTSTSTTTTLAASGGLAFGEQYPLEKESAISWQTWSDGSGSVPTIRGDSDWGYLNLNVEGAEGRSAVYNLLNQELREFTITINRYGAGAGTATTYIRGSDTTFNQDDVTPEWEEYTTEITRSWQYVQVRIYK